MRKKKYIPKGRHNPEIQAKKIEVNREQINLFSKTVDALTASHDNHISYLGNFARHDIKNAIQSMDSILYNSNTQDFTEQSIESLNANLKIIRETMENFSRLVPYSKDETFTLRNLIIAIELLTRNDIYNNKINLIKDIPDNYEIYFKLPFQSVLQMFNNLIINSIKALESVEKPYIMITTLINESNLTIGITDNGKVIASKDTTKIFDFGVSTTGGSGIGLYHAQYLCELFKGNIEVDISDSPNSKTFLVNLPINNKQ